MNPEPRMQRSFRIGTLAAALAIIAITLLANRHFAGLPDREPLGPAVIEIRFRPVELSAAEFAPLHLVGAWIVSGDGPRFGGISAVAVDGGKLIALSDAGAVIRFPKPLARVAKADVRDLPDGPGDPRFKSDRDSEAIAPDPEGRGWWVSFENLDSLWLYDPGFERALERVPVPAAGLSWNTGIEGLAASERDLLLLPESGGRLLRLDRFGWSEELFNFQARRISGATSLAPGSLLVIERRLGFFGFANALVRLDRCRAGYCLAWRKRLPVGPLDNVEAIATERLPSGATRLWLMTDDNLGRPFRTVLIAADLPQR